MYAVLGVESYSARAMDIASKLKLHTFGGLGGSVKITHNYWCGNTEVSKQQRVALGWGRVVLKVTQIRRETWSITVTNES